MSIDPPCCSHISSSRTTPEYRGLCADSGQVVWPFGRPSSSRPLRRLRALVACAALLLCCVTALGAAFESEDEGWEGLSGFISLARETLGSERVLVRSVLDWEKLTAHDALIVVHPVETLDFAQASVFLESGGRLALLDDHGRGDALLERFRIAREPTPRDPETTLRDNPQLAIATPTESAPGVGQRHPIVAEVDQVVTNHPSALRPNHSVDLTPLLEIPTLSGKSALIALVGVIGNTHECGLDTPGTSELDHCGRLVALSDPSIFINHMLRYPGNRALATGLLEYLLPEQSHSSSGVVYVLVNEFTQHGAIAGTPSLLERLQRRLHALLETLKRFRDRGMPHEALRGLAALCALLIGGLLLQAVSRTQAQRTPRFAEAPTLVAQGGPVGRAAVLAARTTHPALAALELKTALEETLRQRLQLPNTASTTAITQAAEESGLLTAKSSAKLRQMLNELGRIETGLRGGQRMRLKPSDLEHLRVTTLALVAEVETTQRRT